MLLASYHVINRDLPCTSWMAVFPFTGFHLFFLSYREPFPISKMTHFESYSDSLLDFRSDINLISAFSRDSCLLSLRHLFTGWWVASFISNVSLSERLLLSSLSVDWLAMPFKIVAFLSITSTGGSSNSCLCSPFFGSNCFTRDILCSSTSNEGSSLGFEWSCSVGAGEGAGDERGVGIGVIWTWTTLLSRKRTWLLE